MFRLARWLRRIASGIVTNCTVSRDCHACGARTTRAGDPTGPVSPGGVLSAIALPDPCDV